MRRFSSFVLVLLLGSTVHLAGAQATYTTSGPVVDKMKATVAAYESGDWAKYRSAFADTVTISNNTVAVSLDERVEEHKAIHSVFRDIHFVNPVYGAIEGDDGVWALLWGTWTGTVRSTGETIQLAVHVASLQAGGKTAAEFGFWDNSRVAPVMEAAMSGN